jgi:hypothetical protein
LVRGQNFGEAGLRRSVYPCGITLIRK